MSCGYLLFGEFSNFLGCEGFQMIKDKLALDLVIEAAKSSLVIGNPSVLLLLEDKQAARVNK